MKVILFKTFLSPQVYMSIEKQSGVRADSRTVEISFEVTAPSLCEQTTFLLVSSGELSTWLPWKLRVTVW